MDFVSSMNSLALTEEQQLILPEWPRVGGFGDPLPDLPFNLLSAADSTEDGLPPLPESLDHFDAGFGGFSSSLLPCQYDSSAWLAGGPSSDIDLDALCCWPEAVLGGGDFGVLADDAAAAVWDGENRTQATEDDLEEANRRKKKKRPAAAETAAGPGASRMSCLGFEEIKRYFHMPITKAAKEMNVGLTVLKKRCRELRIARWPHRKMKSLNSLIHNVQELGKGVSEEEAVRRELERLEEHRRQMEENPEVQLSERTKKLRQACFKANYKRRRLLMMQQQHHLQ